MKWLYGLDTNISGLTEENIRAYVQELMNPGKGYHHGTGTQQGLIQQENETPHTEPPMLEPKWVEPLMTDIDDLSLEAADEAPPGFEGTPRYKVEERRSPRLQGKNVGRYVSAVDKARANKGFLNVSDLMQKPKQKGKNKNNAKPSLEYLKSYDPLTEEHAQAVVAMAGVKMDDELKVKINEAATVRCQLGTTLIKT